jgi:hypothetical protein
VDVSKLTDTELKALAYDYIAQKEQAQLNLNIINTELLRRKQVPPNRLGTELVEILKQTED